jgi:Arc/MetJ family transcription regulator
VGLVVDRATGKALGQALPGRQVKGIMVLLARVTAVVAAAVQQWLGLQARRAMVERAVTGCHRTYLDRQILMAVAAAVRAIQQTLPARVELVAVEPAQTAVVHQRQAQQTLAVVAAADQLLRHQPVGQE